MVIDILKGILTLFYNPVFYLLIIGLMLFGYQRVRRERVSFGLKVHGVMNNVFNAILPSIIMGLAGTAVLLGAGVALPPGMIVLISLCYLLLMLSTQLRYLSPYIAIGAAGVIAYVLPPLHTGSSLINGWSEDVRHLSFSSFGIYFVLTLLIECLLVYIWGGRQTSPRLIDGKRGKKVGAHEISKLWIVPLFFLVPVSAGHVHPAAWWPLSHGPSFSFAMLPIGVGLQQLIIHRHPKKAEKESGNWLLITSIVMAAMIAAGIYFSIDGLIVGAAGIALLSRLALVIYHFYLLDYKSYYFRERKDGLTVVGIIPNTPAERMEIEPGEVITKVNDVRFHTARDFYFALQKNAAYCKLEVKDTAGEARFVKSPIHEGDYHNIGLLFLEPADRNPYEKKKAVAKETDPVEIGK